MYLAEHMLSFDLFFPQEGGPSLEPAGKENLKKVLRVFSALPFLGIFLFFNSLELLVMRSFKCFALQLQDESHIALPRIRSCLTDSLRNCLGYYLSIVVCLLLELRHDHAQSALEARCNSAEHSLRGIWFRLDINCGNGVPVAKGDDARPSRICRLGVVRSTIQVAFP